MSSNTFFEVPVTVDASATAIVTVLADSASDAGRVALEHVMRHGAAFTLDEDSIHTGSAYLPDPFEGAQPVENVLDARGADEFPAGLVIVCADHAQRHAGLLLNGKLIQTATCGDDGCLLEMEALSDLEKRLAAALGTHAKTVYCMQEGDSWTWDDVVEQLTTKAPRTEAQLCEEFRAFCRAEGLPQQSADELLDLSLTETQQAYITRFLQRWEHVTNS